MNARPHPLRWVPAFVVGVCAATAAEIATGLLLYTGPGLMRSLTTVLAVESGALGIGVWLAPGPRPDLVDALRRRWMLCLTAFLGATLFSAFWSLVQAVGGSALGQGLGLAFLAGFPLYACGGVLGGMATASATDPTARMAGVGAPAALGAALGFAATGVSLPQVLTPASLFLMCLVLLSAGGLVYGSVLDTRVRVQKRGMRASPTGVVQVEDRHLLARDRAARILTEGMYVRRWVSLDDGVDPPWDVAVYRAFGPVAEGAGRALVVGGGASLMPRKAVREHPSVRVTVVERSRAVTELGQEHLATGLDDGQGRLDVRVGNLDDLVESLDGGFGLVVVDTAAFGPMGGLEGLSRAARARLCQRVAPGGVLALGPVPPEEDAWSFPEGWAVARYRRPLPPDVDSLGVCIGPEEVLCVGRAPAGDAAPWPPAVETFSLDAGGDA